MPFSIFKSFYQLEKDQLHSTPIPSNLGALLSFDAFPFSNDAQKFFFVASLLKLCFLTSSFIHFHLLLSVFAAGFAGVFIKNHRREL